MSALLIRRRRPLGDPATRRVHKGIAGAGRIVRSLASAGVVLDRAGTAQLLLDPNALVDRLNPKVIDRVFDQVALGSHLVNVADAEIRVDLLRFARDLGPTVLVEHHPIDGLETAADVPPTPGSSAGMIDVRIDPPFVSAVSVLDIGGPEVRQPFRAQVLSDAELDEALAAAGLCRTHRLNPTWLEAARVQGDFPGADPSPAKTTPIARARRAGERG